MKKTVLLFSFVLLQCCVAAQHWQALLGWPNRFIACLYPDSVNDKLYFGGDFSFVNGEHIRGIGSWNGTQWDSLGAGTDEFNSVSYPNNTLALCRYNNEILAGGAFTEVDTIYSHFLARWNGSQWDSMWGGQQPNSVVDDIKVYNNELYICGPFDSIGNVPADCIAKWNGVAWQCIGSNYHFSANASLLSKIDFYHGNLYAAGMFLDPQGNICRFAKWDGINWYFFSNEIHGGFCQIDDLQVFNNKLYVGGLFFASDGNAGTGIISWNDTAFNAVGGSVQIGINNSFPTVKDMCVHNGKLYCAGNFEKIGGVIADGLAVWDETQWCTFGSTFNAGIGSVEFYHDTMYVGGGFIQLDTSSISNLAKWIGGNYVDTCGVISTGINQSENSESEFNIFPNPANDILTIQLKNLQEKNIDIKIYDVLGQTVIERKENNLSISSSGELQEQINVSGLGAGVYLVCVHAGENIFSQKIVIQR
ncbi:MAG: T9SS type A sorting domain-containing protein [Bacteroidetes bacterium]|nr:T9SS type A sorting domain-containing protein [Bacteroidota bacterium]